MGKIAVCQSCGMPLNKEENCGTNEDNSKTNEYCKFCFENGKFTNPDLTMSEVIEKSAQMAKNYGCPRIKQEKLQTAQFRN